MDAFRWALFSYYIFIGTVQVMLMKASGESAKGTGKSLAYNTASAMVFIEFIKILICLGLEQWQGEEERAKKGETRTSTTLNGFLFYAVPGFLYAVENNLKIPATVFLHPHVFALFNNSKVIFAAIGMVVLLGKRFSTLQWLSMALLGLSLCVAKVQMLLPASSCGGEKTGHHDGHVGVGLMLVGIALVLAASIISGMAGVFNELLLKKRDPDVGLWRKNIWTYQWGVIFNGLGWVMSSWMGFGAADEKWASGDQRFQADMFSDMLRGYDFWVWAMIFVTALLGISVSLIMKFFDNVVKCFGGSLILYSTTLASMVVFGSRVDAGFVLGLLVYSVSSFYYAGDHNQKLEKYYQYEVEIEALIKAKSQQTKAQEMEALTAAPVDTQDDASPGVRGSRSSPINGAGAVVGKRT